MPPFLLLCLQNTKSWHLKRLNKTHDSQPLRLPGPAPHLLFPSCTPSLLEHSWKFRIAIFLLSSPQSLSLLPLPGTKSLLNVLPPFEMNPQLPLSPTVSCLPHLPLPRLLSLIKPHPGCWEGKGERILNFRAAGSGGLQPHVFL